MNIQNQLQSYANILPLMYQGDDLTLCNLSLSFISKELDIYVTAMESSNPQNIVNEAVVTLQSGEDTQLVRSLYRSNMPGLAVDVAADISNFLSRN